MARSISLANKCQLLFGGAVVLIVTAALIAPWVRVGTIIDQSELSALRDIAAEGVDQTGAIDLQRLDATASGPISEDDFVRSAIEQFRAHPKQTEHHEAIWDKSDRVFRYARASRDDAGALTSIVLIERRSPRAAGRLFVNRLFLLSSGLVAGIVAVIVFYLITTRLILSPVRSLKETAERIMEGDPDARAAIKTNDEFEQLGDAFNDMLAGLEEKREQLRAANQSLDLRVTRLEQANLALHESAKLKGDFIAAVSHELRTPLNSIIGFAELLEEIAARDQTAELVHDQKEWSKRKRYLDHIAAAGRTLLEMINELLDMAKIEAGKMDLHVERMSVTETCEGLLALIRPQAERKNISLVCESAGSHRADDDVDLAESSPIIETDARKFQQILFNFLSNAAKFTPEGGQITLRTERLIGSDGESRIRISVIDTGAGIAPEEQERIFEKFIQLEGGHTRLHAGTGLGLAIARDLTAMIQGEIQVVSEAGRGSMFCLIVPMRMDPDNAAEMTLRLAGRSRSDETPGAAADEPSAAKTSS